MPFISGGDPLLNRTEPAPTPSFSDRSYSKTNPLEAHQQEKNHDVEGIFHNKHGQEVDHLSKYDMRKNIAKDVKELKVELRKKMGLKGNNPGDYKRFGEEVVKSVHGSPDTISRAKILKEISEENWQLERDRRAGDLRAVDEDKKGLRIWKWLIGKK